jgi:hypothetical protein
MASGGPRYSTKIRAKRIALGYFKQPHPFRRWRFILSVAVPGLGLAWLLVHAVQGDQRIYNSGSVSTAHTMFEKDCAVCHGPGPGGPAPAAAAAPAAVSLAGLTGATPSGYWARVTDNACQACHAGPQHHVQAAFTPRCASCHVEHGGRAQLVQIADQHCVQCHRDLKTKDGQPPAYHATITALRQHPEFAVSVRDGDKVLRVRLDQKSEVRDTAQIKLNHAKHLKVNLKGLEEVKAQLGDAHLARAKDGLQLACTFCHRPDAAGQYMEPVAYEKNCAACHPLDFDGRFVDSAAPDKPAVVPHTAPGVVHAFLRGTIADAFDQCQSIPAGEAGKALRQRCVDLELAKAPPAPAGEQPRGLRRGGGEETPAPEPETPRGLRRRSGLEPDIVLVQDEPPRRLRRSTDEESGGAAGGGATGAGPTGGGAGASAGGGAPAGGSASTGGAAWVATQLGAIEPTVFKQRCEFCHTLNKSGGPIPQIVPTGIPARWLPHARFDHGVHRPLACVECHKATTSTETKDVLMPSVATCRDCHHPQGGARSGCVECHRYHDKAHERDPDGPFKVRQLLSGPGRARAVSD